MIYTRNYLRTRRTALADDLDSIVDVLVARASHTGWSCHQHRACRYLRGGVQCRIEAPFGQGGIVDQADLLTV